MSDQLVVRGLACPYDQEIVIRGITESVAPGAFAKQRCQVPVLTGEHRGQAIAMTTRLFSYADGLGFEAAIGWSHESSLWLARVLRSQRWGASVQFANWTADEKDGCRRIKAGQISHISIVSSPAYPTTVCWDAAQPTADIPSHVMRTIARWDGAAKRLPEHTSSARLGGAPTPAGAPGAGRGHGRPALKRTIPPSVKALFASPAWVEVAAKRGWSKNV